MSYTSYGFRILTVVGLVISRMVRPSGKKWILLVMSLIFMAAAGGYGTIVFWFISTAAGFAAALLLANVADTKEKQKRIILLAAVAFQLGLLAYFKYANLPAYTKEAFYELAGRVYEFEEKERLALAGISFYILMIIGYDIDVYRGETLAIRSFPEFSLFTG